MQTVEDSAGRRLLVVKRAAESWLVRDPATGEEQYVDPEAVDPVAGASPLATAAGALDDDARRLVLAARDDRALGLLCHLAADGPVAVRALLGETDLCESDLHGLLAELRAAGLVAEQTVDGRRGYALSGRGADALDRLR
ncbi:MAG: hypothetical protein A07HB70_00053 [uncultured archaeon A07HB70]|nr:MAG: hypothetical protein A07HB70_00053 [uncultured archaeon A07HB70]